MSRVIICGGNNILGGSQGGSGGGLPQPQGSSQAKLVGYFDKNSKPIEWILKNQYEYVKPKPSLRPSDYPFEAPSSGVMPIYTIYSKYDYIQLTLPNNSDPSSYSFHSLNNNTQTLQAQNANTESIDGTAYNQQLINQQFVKEIIDLKKRSLRMVGYIGSSQPSSANEGDIYYQSSASSETGNDLPTTFPIQVKVWSNGSWSSTTKAFTPDDNDLITNTNNKLAFVWNKGWSPNNQAQSTTDNITIGRNNNNALYVLNEGIDTQQLKNNSVNNSKVLDNTLTFSKINTNSVANGLENASNKFVKADDLFDTAIVSNTTQIQSKTGGGKEIEIDLKNTAGTSITKASIDLDETATQNSNNPITSDGAYKDKLNNTNSTLEYDDTDANKDVINLELKNNNGDTKIDKTIDFNDKIVFEDKTQELFNKTLDFDTTGATKNIAENIPLSSLAKQTASDDKKILQVVGNDHHIDLRFLDVVKEVNSIPQTKDDEDILLHRANDKHLYYWNEDESKYVAVGGGGGGVVKVNALPVDNIDSEVIYAVEETNTQATPAKTYIHYWIYDSNLSKWYEIYTDKYGDVVYENNEQTLTNKTIDADDNTITDITGANFKTQDTTEAGKVWGIKNDGTTTLITPSGSSVHYVSTFNGIEGEENALYYLTTLCVVGAKVYERGFYRYTNNNWTFIPASVMRSGITLRANQTQYLFSNELQRDDIVINLTLPNGERVEAGYTITTNMITFTFSQEAVEQYADERIQVVYF